MGQKFMFEESFLGWNFNFDHEKKLTFFSMVTTIRGGEKTNPNHKEPQQQNKIRIHPRSLLLG